jgi:putative flippase GtrA
VEYDREFFKRYLRFGVLGLGTVLLLVFLYWLFRSGQHCWLCLLLFFWQLLSPIF